MLKQWSVVGLLVLCVCASAESQGRRGPKTYSSLVAVGSLAHQATVALTDDQIKTLPSAAVEVVAAPGSDRVVLPVTSFIVLDASSGAYSADVGASWLFQWATNSYATSPTPVAARLTSADVTVVQIAASPFLEINRLHFENIVSGDSTVMPLTQAVNQSLQLKDEWRGVANYTGGHAANTLKVALTFHVYDVASGRFLTTDESGWNDTTGAFD